jgi:Restriction endonuclease
MPFPFGPKGRTLARGFQVRRGGRFLFAVVQIARGVVAGLILLAGVGSIAYLLIGAVVVVAHLAGLTLARTLLCLLVFALGVFALGKLSRSRCSHGTLGAKANPAKCTQCAAEENVARERAAVAAERMKREAAAREQARLRAEEEKARKREEERRERQARKEVFTKKVRQLAFLQSMDPLAFQRLIWLLYQRKGFSVTETPFSRDGGADGFIEAETGRMVLQCKRFKHDIGEPVVRDLLGTMIHNGAVHGILITTGRISNPAKDFASGKQMTLIDGSALLALIEEVRLSAADVPDDFVSPVRVPAALADDDEWGTVG